MVNRQYPPQRRSTRLRRRARLAMQGRTKPSVLFGWFRVKRDPLMSPAGGYETPDPVDHIHHEPLPTGTKIILILAVVVFLFIALIPFLAMIKLLFTPG